MRTMTDRPHKPRVLLMQLSERTSARGTKYLSGWLGKASVVGFLAEEPDKFGNPMFNVYASTPDPRPDPGGDPAKGYARQRPESVAQRSPAQHQVRGDGWRGSQYRRPANGARRASAADGEALVEDDLADIGRG